MKKTTTVMVINDIITSSNMLIVKSDGSEMINRFSETITPKILSDELDKSGIYKYECDIIIVDESHEGEVRAKRI